MGIGGRFYSPFCNISKNQRLLRLEPLLYMGSTILTGAPGGHLTKCLRSKAFKPVPSYYTGVLASYVNSQLFSYVCTFVCT
jgi:hypothetical protein